MERGLGWMNQVNQNVRRGSTIKNLMGYKDRVYNKNSQGCGYAFERPKCTSCGRKHSGSCLADTDGCFGCSNKGHKMRYCCSLKSKGK